TLHFQPRKNSFSKGEFSYIEVDYRAAPASLLDVKSEASCMETSIDEFFEKISKHIIEQDLCSIIRKESRKQNTNQEGGSSSTNNLSNGQHESIISPDGKDRRKKIRKTKKFSRSMHGRLLILFNSTDPSKKSIIALGSGVVISPQNVLTCGHNLYLDDEKHEKFPYLERTAAKIDFFPALKGKKVYHKVNSRRYIVHPEWLNSRSE